MLRSDEFPAPTTTPTGQDVGCGSRKEQLIDNGRTTRSLPLLLLPRRALRLRLCSGLLLRLLSGMLLLCLFVQLYRKPVDL